MIRPAFLVFAAVTLFGCAPPAEVERRTSVATALPPMLTFSAAPAIATNRANSTIARDFLDLSFMLESGRALPVLTRFEGPVTVRVTGRTAPSLSRDLQALLARLRREARIDISRVAPDANASITIEVVGRAELQRVVPQAACFVVPRVASWDEFRRARRTDKLDWTTLTTRDRMAIFLPGDVSPQEIRDCLHEELAQALGPLNDLYRLDDSIFNDDNFRTVLTGFDMLVLRATYDPALRSGMTRQQVAERLPAILDRLNPGGRGGGRAVAQPTSRDWIDAMETALDPRTSQSRRRAAAKTAVTLARRSGWSDNRLAFALFAQGRLSLGNEPDQALAAFLEAGALYDERSGSEIHAAHVAMQVAAFTLSTGQAEAAIRIVDAHAPAARAAENAALLATLLMVKAEALSVLGRNAEADAVRRESLGWGRYGFGNDRDVLARQAEIAAISPRGRQGGPT